MSDEMVAFLKACVDEDERVARDALDPDDPWDNPHGEFVGRGGPRFAHVLRHGPARGLAEVAAKRGLITQALRWMALRDGEWGCCHDPSEIAAGTCPEEKPDEDLSLRLLASVYARRPGWRSEWAPDEGGSGA